MGLRLKFFLGIAVLFVNNSTSYASEDDPSGYSACFEALHLLTGPGQSPIVVDKSGSFALYFTSKMIYKYDLTVKSAIYQSNILGKKTYARMTLPKETHVFGVQLLELNSKGSQTHMQPEGSNDYETFDKTALSASESLTDGNRKTVKEYLLALMKPFSTMKTDTSATGLKYSASIRESLSKNCDFKADPEFYAKLKSMLRVVLNYDSEGSQNPSHESIPSSSDTQKGI